MVPGIATVMHSPVRDSIVLIDILLHSLIGFLIVGYFTDYDPLYGAVGGLIPNIDLLFDVWPRSAPLFVHRGLLHTPFFLLAVVTVVYLVGRLKQVNYSNIAFAIGLGYAAELALDLFEGKDGVMLAFPFSLHHFAIPVPHMDIWVPFMFAEALILALYYIDNRNAFKV